MRKLSELEGVAVGIIHQRQPCTAYSLRKELKASPSSHWQASAGSIYPLLTRLEAEGFIGANDDNDDGRGRKLLSITAQGKKALKAWVKEISNSTLLAQIYDPMRTRIFFMSALSNAEQLSLTEKLHSGLKNQLVAADQHLEEQVNTGDTFAVLGSTGGVINAKARLEVLKKVMTKLRQK